MIKRLLILFLMCICTSCIFAQNAAGDSALIIDQSIAAPVADEEDYETTDEPITDTILDIREINISPDTVLQWKNKKELAYIKNLDSLLKASQQKEASIKADNSRLHKPSFLESIFNASIFKIILWMMATFFVGVIIYQLVKNQGIFKKTFATGAEEEQALPQEDLLQQNFDGLINQSFRLQDYRTAIRYQFLKTLQILRDNNHVEFAADKTNSRYVQELPLHWRNDFARLVLNYEYVWYGNFTITHEQYGQLQAQYSSFNKKI